MEAFRGVGLLEVKCVWRRRQASTRLGPDTLGQTAARSWGGVLEGIIPDPESGVQKRRCWISVAR